MNVEWIKCLMKSRCRLELINLDNKHFDNLEGVYVIWQGNDKKNVIKVGKGLLRETLAAMKNDKEVQKFAPDLFVTWAAIPAISLDGVEAFLNSEMHPRIPHFLSAINPISINLP